MTAAAEVAAGRLARPGWADRDVRTVGGAEGTADRAGGVTMDQEAFDAFYQASFGRLVGQIYAMCGNMAEAQDCVQEAFIRAWDRRRTLDLDQSPEAWVRTVAYRLAVSRWRRARKSLLPPDRAHTPAPPAEPDVHRVALARALQALPPDQRRAIVLYHLCDLSVAEVAAEVNAPTGTVKARLSRGRAALATLLADSEEARRG
jgi:RNA polymerase sigma-70 factor (ECF subfamily)